MNIETWVRPGPTRTVLHRDALLAAILLLAALTTSQLYMRIGLIEESPPAWVWAIGLGFATVPLIFRRRYPITVMVCVAAGFFVCGQFGVPEVLIINIAMFTGVYTVGAWSQNRVRALWARVILVMFMLGWLVIVLIIASSDTDFLPELSRASVFSAYATYITIQIITNMLFFGGAAYFGEKSWRGARTLAQLEAQGRELDLERQTSAVQAVALDRLSIARELHDVVAHHISVIGLHAAAARRTLTQDKQKAADALEIVEESASATIAELKQMVHTLRAPDSEHETQTVGLAHMHALIEGSNLSGVPTLLIFAGNQRPLPFLVDVTLYRVVQEALTNVRKHAGTGAEAQVRVRFSDHDVEVEVSDNGVVQKLGDINKSHGGLGLQGMRERIGAVGGTLLAQTRERGGFMIRASVPLTPRKSPTHKQ